MLKLLITKKPQNNWDKNAAIYKDNFMEVNNSLKWGAMNGISRTVLAN